MNLVSANNMYAALIGLTVAVLIGHGGAVYLEKSAYHDLVFELEDKMPQSCQTVLKELEIAVTSASQYLFSALDGRAYIGSSVIIIPNTWPDSCIPFNHTLMASSGERTDVEITSHAHPVHSEHVWTEQTGGCGEAGEKIYMPYMALQRETIGKELVREWAKYRYGVFDEIGYAGDAVYPRCYVSDRRHVTGCSDAPINLPPGMCSDNAPSSNGTSQRPKLADLVDENARSSIMFAVEANSVAMFCDSAMHDRYAPTKHNQMCDRQSTLDVILQHEDFKSKEMYRDAPATTTYPDGPTQSNEITATTIVNTTPRFVYKKRRLTRYVIVIDQSKDMQVRESWSFLRNAIRKWVVYDLPANTEVGILLANETGTDKVLPITLLKESTQRDSIASFIPYTPSDSRQITCMSCAVKDAKDMLLERKLHQGDASSVILVIAPGMDFNTDLKDVTATRGIRVATINYPGIIRRQPLDRLAEETDGVAYTIFESKQNGEKTFLTTYFELTNVLQSITAAYHEGPVTDIPIEIHRKKLVDVQDDQSSLKKTSRSVTGSFNVDPAMGLPAAFYVYTYDIEPPLIQGLQLVAPSGQVYNSRSDLRLAVKQLTIPANINETGSWSYKIERINGNPQPHFVQVMATPRSDIASVIQARAWLKRTKDGGPFVLYAEVKKGYLPVSNALVEVTVSRPELQCNSSTECKEKFKLHDTGSGDPDIMRGDGIYTRYFDAASTGAGTYKFEFLVNDNGNTAYALAEHTFGSDQMPTQERCCGSFVPTPSKQPLPTFQRFLPAITVFLTKDEVALGAADERGYGRIGDLRAEQLDNTKVRLTWTSPDIGGRQVSRYEVKYATTVNDIVDNYETAAIFWPHETPLTYSVGDDTSFTLNFLNEMQLIGQPLYFAIRAYAQLSKDARPGQVSNYVRVFIPPMPPVQPAGGSNADKDGNHFDLDNPHWPYDPANPDASEHYDGDHVVPKVAQTLEFGPELIIPIAVGLLLLLILCIIYCYFCWMRRRHGDDDSDEQKKPIKGSSTKNGSLSSHHNGNSSVNVIMTTGSSVSTTTSSNSSSTLSPSGVPNGGYQQQQQFAGSYHSTQYESPSPPPFSAIDTQSTMQQYYSTPNPVHPNGSIHASHMHDTQSYIMTNEMNDHHIIGLPIVNGGSAGSYASMAAPTDDSQNEPMRKRFSLVHHQDQQFLDELKQQQHHQQMQQQANLAIISGQQQPGSTLTRGGNPAWWPASQLLHEHEQRRISPMDDMMIIMANGNNGAPAVPPLPPSTSYSNFDANNQNSNYHIYGTMTQAQVPQIPPPHPASNGVGNRAFNPSLQGSLNSVHSSIATSASAAAEKKRRNITMV